MPYIICGSLVVVQNLWLLKAVPIKFCWDMTLHHDLYRCLTLKRKDIVYNAIRSAVLAVRLVPRHALRRGRATPQTKALG